MKLTLESLREVGAFTGGPVRREVEWVQGGEVLKAEVFIRPMSYHTAAGDILAGGSDLLARRLSQCVCHEDGSPVFQISDITGIGADGKPIMVKVDGKEVERGPINKSLSDALIVLVGDVSGLGKTTPNSKPETSSGTSLSSQESAAGPSKKPSET